MKRKLSASTIILEILFVALTIIMLIPVYYFVIGSFKSRTDIVQRPLILTLGMIKKTGIDNFEYVWEKMRFFRALKNTTIITAVSLLIEVIAGSLAGFTFARIRKRGFQLIYIGIITIMVVPFNGCLLPLVRHSTILGIYGTVWASILTLTAWHLPFTTFLFAEFMRALPEELEEAAYIDGCGTFAVYRRIFLPLLKPVIATCCIRSGKAAWNDFIISNSMGNPSKAPTLMVILNKFFGERGSEYGYAFAGMLMASLPVIILYLFLQKYFIKGLTAGAVKG